MAPLRHSWHLVTRFIGVLRSRPLGPDDQEIVSNALTAAEAGLFWEQQAIDQRHAFDVASRVRSVVDDDDAVAAALLHDVGKRHSRLGPIGRSLATVFSFLRLPLTESWRSYVEHEELGARDLREVGARPLAVAFASGDPEGDPDVWAVLVAADDGRLAPGEKGRAKGGTGNSMPPEVNG